MRSGFVLYEIIEVADDRCKCAVLIRDEDEAGVLGLSLIHISEPTRPY